MWYKYPYNFPNYWTLCCYRYHSWFFIFLREIFLYQEIIMIKFLIMRQIIPRFQKYLRKFRIAKNFLCCTLTLENGCMRRIWGMPILRKRDIRFRIGDEFWREIILYRVRLLVTQLSLSLNKYLELWMSFFPIECKLSKILIEIVYKIGMLKSDFCHPVWDTKEEPYPWDKSHFLF